MTSSISCSISSTVTRPASDLISASTSAVSIGRHSLRRLVEHQQLGLERHAERDLDPALVTVREIAHELVRPVVESEFLEDLIGAYRGSRQTIQPHEKAGAVLEALAGQPDVLENGQSEEQIGDLEGARDADPRQDVGRLAGDVAPIEFHQARIRSKRAGDQIERGALARPVRTDDRRDPARLRLEA